MDKGIVFFGSSEFSVTVLSKLLSSNTLIKLIVTTPDQPSGRHLKLTPNPVKVFAQQHSIPTTDNSQLTTIDTDSIGLVAAFGKIIPAQTLNTFNNQIYNIHPSLLPKYRGPSPLQTQILDQSPVGVTLIRLDTQMDHGPIISQYSDSLQPTDTWITLGHKLFEIGTELFLNSDLNKSIPQDDTLASYTKKITRQDGFLPWTNFNSWLTTKDQRLTTKFKAFYKWPGIWTINPENKRVKLVSLDPILIQEEGRNPTPWH